MTEIQYAEEALKDSREFMHTMMMIKWILLSMSIAIWGMIVYFLLQEIPKWWKSFNKKKKKPFTLGQMNKDLTGAVRRRREYWDG